MFYYSFDEYSMTIPINYEPYTIILSDTAGQEEYDKLRRMAYRFVRKITKTRDIY